MEYNLEYIDREFRKEHEYLDYNSFPDLMLRLHDTSKWMFESMRGGSKHKQGKARLLLLHIVEK